jgi:glutathione S-transferase
MTILRLWGRARAANVQKVTWCLGELGMDYVHEDGAPAGGSPADAAYLASRKADIVPIIDHDEFVLWEGNAIVRYLADLHGAPPFWPADPARRADAGRWMDYQLSTIRGHIHPLMREAPDAEQTAHHAQMLGKAMEVLERALDRHDYLVGPDFTAGDIPLGIVTYRWMLLDIDRPRLPKLEAWCGRLQRRAAFRANICPPEETFTPLRSAV